MPLNESKDYFGVKQVEYQFSDMSLLANESLAKHISKDPEGYGKKLGQHLCILFILMPFSIIHDFGFLSVPVSVVASTKKMKSLISNNHMLAQALRSSSKLVSCLIE